MEKTIIKTSEKGWLEALAKTYKEKQSAIIIDDADTGINPESETLLNMGLKAKLSMHEWVAVLIALGMSAVGAGAVVFAFLDPDPTSKLAVLTAGGMLLIFTGGLTAIKILTKQKPPQVRISQDGFEIYWDS